MNLGARGGPWEELQGESDPDTHQLSSQIKEKEKSIIPKVGQ